MRQLQAQRMLNQTADQNLMRQQQQMYSGMGIQPNGVNMAKQAMQNNRTG
jgi:hypothetical protein